MLLLLTASYSTKVLEFAGKKSGFVGIPRGLFALQYNFFFSPLNQFSVSYVLPSETLLSNRSAAVLCLL